MLQIIVEEQYCNSNEQDCLEIMKNSVSVANLDSLQYAILNWIAQHCHCRLEVLQTGMTRVFGLQQLMLGELIREHATTHGTLATDSNMAGLITGGGLLTMLLLLLEQKYSCILSFDCTGLHGSTFDIFRGLINSINLKSKLQRLSAGYLAFIVVRKLFSATPNFVARISSLWLAVIEARQQPYTIHSLCTDYLHQPRMVPFSRFTFTEWNTQRTKLCDDLALWVTRRIPVLTAKSYIKQFPQSNGLDLAESLFGRNILSECIEN